MKHTYTNTRNSPVRVFTSKGAVMIGGGQTVTFDEPLSSAPYWVVAEAAAVKEEIYVETTVTTSTEASTTTEKTTRRRKVTKKIEE